MKDKFKLKEIKKYMKEEDIQKILNERKNKKKKKKKNIIKRMLGFGHDDNDDEMESQAQDFDGELYIVSSDSESDVADEPLRDITQVDNKLYKKKPASFDILIEALYDASLKAQRKVQQAHLQHLDWYFKSVEVEGEEVLEPRVIKIKVPSTDDKSSEKWDIIEIPLISLVKHNHLKIQEIDIELNLNIGDLIYRTMTDKKCKDHHYHKRKKHKWKIRVSPPIQNSNNCSKVKIKFSFDEPLEALSRLTEKYDRFL